MNEREQRRQLAFLRTHKEQPRRGEDDAVNAAERGKRNEQGYAPGHDAERLFAERLRAEN